MKNYSNYKFIQLIIDLALALISISLLLRPEVKSFVFASKPATFLFVLVWLLLLLNLVFLAFDYHLISNIKQEHHSLYSATYSDKSGIPNRFSCDAVIEKYIDSVLPFTVGCIVIDFTNLMEINNTHSHSIGNQTLKEFSAVLSASATNLCFVGRNGGNKFLAIFENCNNGEIDIFLANVATRIVKHNSTPGNIRIEYKTGIALNRDERERQITKLISLANSRVYEDK